MTINKIFLDYDNTEIEDLIAQYKSIFSTTFAGIAIISNANIVSCNHCCEEIFGYSQAELNNTVINKLFPSDSDFELASKGAYATLMQEREFFGETLMRRKSGELFWCGFNGITVGVNNSGEKIKAVLWIFQDINKHKLLEIVLRDTLVGLENIVKQRTDSLEIANQLLEVQLLKQRQLEQKHRTQQSELARMARINTAGEMVSSLIHELGQPLASMLNYVHGCLMRFAVGNFNPDELKHGLIQAVRHAEQAGEIVRRVRNTLHRHTPKKEMLDINQVLRGILESLSGEALCHDISLRISRSEYPLRIFIDRVEIEQIIVNIVKNSFEALLEFTGQPKIVEISCHSLNEDYIIIAVSDNGPGVPVDLRQIIFEPYFTTKEAGMGFGLSICCSMIEMHGGEIRLGDSLLGGALFEVLLPLRGVE